MLIFGHRGNGATNTPTSTGHSYHRVWQNSVDRPYNGRSPKAPESLINYPENSMAAFKHALEHGADGIELDVYLSRDGVPMVIHDDELSKNARNVPHPNAEEDLVSRKTAAELRDYHLGYGMQIPTLSDVLDLMEQYNRQHARRTGRDLQVIIELKGENAEGAVIREIAKRRAKGWSNDQFLCCSFNYDNLRKMRAMDNTVRLGPGIKSRFLFGDDGVDSNYNVIKREYQPDAIDALQKLHDEIHFSALFPVNTDLKPELAKMAQRNNLDIICWTWNERHPQRNKAQLRKLIEFERRFPDTIHLMTDYPSVVRHQLERLSQNRSIAGGLHTL